MQKVWPKIIPRSQETMLGMRIWEIKQNQKVHLAEQELKQRETRIREGVPIQQDLLVTQVPRFFVE